jgi:hypothetical protein
MKDGGCTCDYLRSCRRIWNVHVIKMTRVRVMRQRQAREAGEPGEATEAGVGGVGGHMLLDVYGSYLLVQCGSSLRV